jgi:hypothetical protein
MGTQPPASGTIKGQFDHEMMPFKRLACKTICFSKFIWLHNVIIRLFINRYKFGLSIWSLIHTSEHYPDVIAT